MLRAIATAHPMHVERTRRWGLRADLRAIEARTAGSEGMGDGTGREVPFGSSSHRYNLRSRARRGSRGDPEIRMDDTSANNKTRLRNHPRPRELENNEDILALGIPERHERLIRAESGEERLGLTKSKQSGRKVRVGDEGEGARTKTRARPAHRAHQYNLRNGAGVGMIDIGPKGGENGGYDHSTTTEHEQDDQGGERTSTGCAAGGDRCGFKDEARGRGVDMDKHAKTTVSRVYSGCERGKKGQNKKSGKPGRMAPPTKNNPPSYSPHAKFTNKQKETGSKDGEKNVKESTDGSDCRIGEESDCRKGIAGSAESDCRKVIAGSERKVIGEESDCRIGEEKVKESIDGSDCRIGIHIGWVGPITRARSHAQRVYKQSPIDWHSP